MKHLIAMLILVLAIVLTYGGHMLKGTPEPFWSTLPTMILAPLSFGYWSWRVKRRQDKAARMVEFAQQQADTASAPS